MTGQAGSRARRRGQPLLVMALLLGSWVGLRALTWQPLAEPGTAGLAFSEAGLPRPLQPLLPHHQSGARRAPLPAGPVPMPREAWTVPLPASPPGPVDAAPPPGSVALTPQPEAGGTTNAANEANVVTVNAPSPLRRVAHVLLWMAAVSDLPLPPGMPESAPKTIRRSLGRWSGDGWLLVRPDGAGAALAAGLPTYGASQMGAVARYRLGSGDNGPTAYLRATAALDTGERGVAAGLSARPLAAVPLRLMAEGRADRFVDGRVHGRAAVLAVTEVAPVTLPGKVRAEFYAQGGYVAGAAATGFVDGQFRLDRLVTGAPGKGELRAGAGVWGGAQRGSARLDVGPSATIGLGQGPVAARVAFDWRFRVAGNAAPQSGPALTISAGF